jgi:iron complex transport system permease protein
MKSLIRISLINAGILLVAFVLSIGLGSVTISPVTSIKILLSGLFPGIPFDLSTAFSTIILEIRLPHAILVALTGASLAGSGAVYQGVFRNPLADPYLIGVASGAGLGAVLGMALHLSSTPIGLFGIPAAAFLGALITILLVYQLARVGKTLPTTTLILAGVAISAFVSALTTFLLLRSRNDLQHALSWLLGGSLMGGWGPVLAMLPYAVIGMAILVMSGHILNVMQFGEEQSQQLGINIELAKALLILAASLTAASAVAFSGLIGFIGLIVPHLVRLMHGPDYRSLIPLSIVGGAIALLLADILSRVVLAPQVLPVGIVTALAGAPFFLWVLRRARTNIQ